MTGLFNNGSSGISRSRREIDPLAPSTAAAPSKRSLSPPSYANNKCRQYYRGNKPYHFTVSQALALAALCSCFSGIVVNYWSYSSNAGLNSFTSLLEFEVPQRAGGMKSKAGVRRTSLEGEQASYTKPQSKAAGSPTNRTNKKTRPKKKAVREIERFKEVLTDSEEEEELFSVKALAEKHVGENGGDGGGGINAPDRGADDGDSYEEDDDDDDAYEDDEYEFASPGSKANKNQQQAEEATAAHALEDDDGMDDDEYDDDGYDDDEYDDDEYDSEEEEESEDELAEEATTAGSSTRTYSNSNSSAATAATVLWPEIDVEELDPTLQITRNDDDATQHPEIAWLMSFPNSGTSFTIHMTREATNCTTATNYGLEGEIKALPSVQAVVGPAGQHGPFLELIRNRPTNIPPTILTKTHCIGYCSICGPKKLLFETPRTFLRGCLSGTRGVYTNTTLQGKTSETGLEPVNVMYSPSLVKRAIHIFRHPLDNIVARFHLEYNEMKATKDHAYTNEFPKNQTGFHRWCKRSDLKRELFETKYIDDDLKAALSKIPCFNEFFKYVQWHNMAFYALDDLNIKVLTLHYHEYSDNFVKARERVLKFLNLPLVGPEYEFHPGKVYRHYYTREQKIAIKSFIKEYATPATWRQLKRYDFEIDGSNPKATE